MSTRKFAVCVVSTLTLGATILTGAPAKADDAAAPTAPSTQAPAQHPDTPPVPAKAKKPNLTADKIAERDQLAKRMGLAADALDGPWHIVNLNSGLCLTIYHALISNDAPVVQFTCDNTWPYNEDWYRYDTAHPAWRHLVNANSGLCLTISGARTDNDAPAVQFTCDNTYPYNEEWYIDPAPDGTWVHLTNYNSGLQLTVSGASLNNEANAVQFEPQDGWPYNELWKFVYSGA